MKEDCLRTLIRPFCKDESLPIDISSKNLVVRDPQFSELALNKEEPTAFRG